MRTAIGRRVGERQRRARAGASLRARVVALACLAAALPLPALGDETSTAQQEVFEAERAFARSMAERSLEAFTRHLADDAVFFGSNAVQRGKPEVVAAWAGFFEGAAAPFSWEPDQVEVLASGTLALSTGKVRDPAGKVIARFNSVWRREAPGVWRVVFDKGGPPSAADLR